MFQMRANIVAMGVIGAALLLPELAQAEQGHASWYALHSRTASGEMMNPSTMTAAHRSLPFGTKVLVENLSNGKSVLVTINDRGPFIAGRIIDVSKAAASSLGMLGSGTARVKVSSSGGGSSKVAAKPEGTVKVASINKTEGASKAEGTPTVKSAKMEGATRAKSTKVAAKSSKSSKSAKVASATRAKSTKTAKASSKPAKIVTASSKGKSTVKSEKRNVAGLMKSTRDLKRVASRASSRKTYAAVSRTSARKAAAVASREVGKGRRGQAKAVQLASSANPYGAFVRSESFIN
jgi:rare lipoprotein A